jgi:hypothetical protein
MSKRVDNDDAKYDLNYDGLVKSVADFTQALEERSKIDAGSRETKKYKKFFEIRDIITLCIQQNEKSLNLGIPVPLPLDDIPWEVKVAFERQKWTFDRHNIDGQCNSFYHTVKKKK